MKKWFIIICIFSLSVISMLYFLIPSNQNTNYQTTVNCTESGISRLMLNEENWQIWWPGQKVNDTLYTYQNYNYRIDKILMNAIELSIFNNQHLVKGFLQFNSYSIGSTKFQWVSKNIFSANPIKRFQQYFKLKKSEKNVENLLADLKKYFDNPENIYGLKIVQQKITDGFFISAKNSFQQYPSTAEIYSLIQSVKEYIKKAGGEEIDSPILHVEKEGPARYEAMVAIATKGNLPSEGLFQLKRMHLGNILMAEVKGGIYTIIKGEEELRKYVSDYKRNSPAIPFQSLITNRLSETDSTKWVTRLYYPIF
jgi:hypothetical protein